MGEAVVASLEPIQQEVRELEKNKDYIDGIIKTNAERAQAIARKTLSKVHRKVGFPDRIR